MTLETIIVIAIAAAFCCYLVYRWQTAVVDSAVPPAPEPYPVPKPDMAEQWVAATSAKLEPTVINPKAAWPFPHGDKP